MLIPTLALCMYILFKPLWSVLIYNINVTIIFPSFEFFFVAQNFFQNFFDFLDELSNIYIFKLSYHMPWKSQKWNNYWWTTLCFCNKCSSNLFATVWFASDHKNRTELQNVEYHHPPSASYGVVKEINHKRTKLQTMGKKEVVGG